MSQTLSHRRTKKAPAHPGSTAATARQSPDRTALCHSILFSAVTFALYARGLPNTFVTDDESEVLKDPLIRSFTKIPGLFAHGVWFFEGVVAENYYRPLKLLAYVIEYHLFAFRPAFWHLASIVLHIAVVLAAYFLVCDLTSRQVAFWTALWFALHPAHVEAVAWIAGGQDVLCALALLLSTWAYHRARSRVSPNLYYGLSVALFFAGLLAKEVALTFPVVILAYDFFYRRKSVHEMLRAWRRYLSFAATLGLYVVLRVRALKGFAPVTSGMHLTLKEMVLSVPVLAVKYFWLALVPTPLSYWHDYVPEHWLGWIPLAAIALVFVLILAVFWLRRVQPTLSFALAWWWLTLAPVLAIPKVSGNVFTERYLYVPSFAFCIFVGWCVLWLRDRASHPAARRGVYVAVAALFVFYTILVVRRLPDWHDTLTLMQKTVQQAPDSAFVNGTLGYVYLQQGRFEDALIYEQRAVQLDPRLWGLWTNLAAIYNATRQWGKAIEDCHHGLAIEPDNHMLLNQVALALWHDGQRDEALQDWRRAIQLAPTDLEARINFATSLYQLGHLDASTEQLIAGLSASPGSEDAYLAHFKLGYIYEQKGAWSAASQEYQLVLAIKSDFVPAREQLETIRAHLENPRP